jgi:flavodoxin
MRKTLVVYHSRSGHTRRVAQTLARRLHADLDEIKLAESRAGPIGYVRCALEAITEATPSSHARRDPHAYDLVIVGTPVWFWSLSSPVRDYLHKIRGARARFAFFCTLGGSGAMRVFETMTTLIGRMPVATLALTDAEIEARETEKIDAFVQTLQGRRHRGAEPPPSRVSHAAA